MIILWVQLSKPIHRKVLYFHTMRKSARWNILCCLGTKEIPKNPMLVFLELSFQHPLKQQIEIHWMHHSNQSSKVGDSILMSLFFNQWFHLLNNLLDQILISILVVQFRFMLKTFYGLCWCSLSIFNWNLSYNGLSWFFC